MASLVLVVEDEPLIRFNVAEALRSEGLEVVGLANGDDALQVIQDRPDVKAIFTDINMPGMIDGLTLVKFVKDAYPGIALFVAYGRPSTSLLNQLPQGAKFYAKPYKVSELVEAIKASIG